MYVTFSALNNFETSSQSSVDIRCLVPDQNHQTSLMSTFLLHESNMPVFIPSQFLLTAFDETVIFKSLTYDRLSILIGASKAMSFDLYRICILKLISQHQPGSSD
jgi:hypothetical protein